MAAATSSSDSFELLFDPVLRLCRLGVAAFGGCCWVLGDLTGVDDVDNSDSFLTGSLLVSMLSCCCCILLLAFSSFKVGEAIISLSSSTQSNTDVATVVVVVGAAEAAAAVVVVVVPDEDLFDMESVLVSELLLRELFAATLAAAAAEVLPAPRAPEIN